MAYSKRPAPAYQEYASSIIASIEFRSANMAARGLWWTLRLECWANGKVPSDPKRLARVLGVTDDLAPLLAEIASFFEDDGEYLTCPELENYRNELNERRSKQSAGGKSGAEKTNASKAKQRSGNSTANPSGSSTATPSGSGRALSIDKSSTEQKRQNQSLGNESIPDDFVSDYESHELSSFPAS